MIRILWLVLPLILAAPVADDLKPGLLGEYFNLGREAREFPYLPPNQKPFLRRVDAEINWKEEQGEFAGCGLSDHFCIRWTGLIRVPADGEYTFFTNSDDGSTLWIDGKLVVDNGGLHALEERSGRIQLKAGDHEVKIEFHENDDKAAVIASWEPPGRAKETIPASAWFHRADPELDKR